MLVIKPTVQNESYIDSTSLVNLTADGTCTGTDSSECVLKVNTSSGDVVQPTKSGRINTKNFAVIRYGRVEVTAKLAAGDWLLSTFQMWPALNYYGAWPASGEIEMASARGNNYSNSDGGNNVMQSALHWGPDTSTDRWQLTSGTRDALHSEYHQKFHTFGLEWSEKYLFFWVDARLAQVTYVEFKESFFKLGGYSVTYDNGTRLVNPWTGAGTSHATPFDKPFYLTLAVTVGGTSGWYTDGVQGKPWVDASTTPRKDFWNARSQWKPTWEKKGHGELVVKKVAMYQQCDDGATDL